MYGDRPLAPLILLAERETVRLAERFCGEILGQILTSIVSLPKHFTDEAERNRGNSQDRREPEEISTLWPQLLDALEQSPSDALLVSGR
jgi:hypothetical protein